MLVHRGQDKWTLKGREQNSERFTDSYPGLKINVDDAGSQVNSQKAAASC